MSRVIPAGWLPPGRRVERVVIHWTAGGPAPNSHDLRAYHCCIDEDGRAWPGVAAGRIGAHVRNLNTGSYGLAACGMAGAIQGKSDGEYPITAGQVERLCQAAAEVLHAYGLDLSERTCLTHSEVTTVYGIEQRGKWDIDRLPFRPSDDAAEVHRVLRGKVGWYLNRLRGLE